MNKFEKIAKHLISGTTGFTYRLSRMSTIDSSWQLYLYYKNSGYMCTVQRLFKIIDGISTKLCYDASKVGGNIRKDSVEITDSDGGFMLMAVTTIAMKVKKENILQQLKTMGYKQLD